MPISTTFWVSHVTRQPLPAAAVLVLLSALLVITVLFAAGTGPYPVSPQQILTILLATASDDMDIASASTVLFQIRFPRVLAAILVGAALSAAGAAYQSLFRNPLVSPDILGVSSGAGFGAVLGILLGLPVAAIQFLGFGGGLLTVMVVVMLAKMLRGSGDVLLLVLAGIVVGALAGAAISLVKVLADPYDQLPAITFWLLGSLAGVKLEDVMTVSCPWSPSVCCHSSCCAGASACCRWAMRKPGHLAWKRAGCAQW